MKYSSYALSTASETNWGPLQGVDLLPQRSAKRLAVAAEETIATAGQAVHAERQPNQRAQALPCLVLLWVDFKASRSDASPPLPGRTPWPSIRRLAP